MFSDVIGKYGGIARDALARWLASYRVHPNLLTVIGLLVTIWAAVLFAHGRFIAAGLDRKSTRLNSSHSDRSRMPSSA
jgi:hypothetical protein